MANKYLLSEALEELGEVIVDKMRVDVPVDTGALRDSIMYEVKDDTLIIHMLEYGQAVNDGTRPHRPPISVIEGWSKRKGLNHWGVAANIEKYGTRAQPFMEPIEEFDREYYKLLDDATYEILEGYVWEKISKYKK